MENIISFLSSGPMAWIVVAIIFGIIEAVTMGLATIWFCGGAVIAAIASLFTGSVMVQIVIFLLSSAVLLYFTRPLAKNKLNAKVEKTNADALIGETGIVITDIKPFTPGQVKIAGKEWTAVCENENLTVPKGEKVTVHSIQGVKLIVEPVEEERKKAVSE